MSKRSVFYAVAQWRTVRWLMPLFLLPAITMSTGSDVAAASPAYSMVRSILTPLAFTENVGQFDPTVKSGTESCNPLLPSANLSSSSDGWANAKALGSPANTYMSGKTFSLDSPTADAHDNTRQGRGQPAIAGISPEEPSDTLLLVSIEAVANAANGQTVEVGIELEVGPSTVYIGGFDLLIDYDQAGLTLVNAEPGELLDNCAWEYFEFRIDSAEGLIRLVGVADINDPFTHPVCLIGGASGTIAKLFVTVADIPDSSFLPMSFYWKDCGDNALAGDSGLVLLVSRYVYDVGCNYRIDADGPLPTYTGAPDTCLDLGGTYPIVRRIDFCNGGVETNGDIVAASVKIETRVALLGDYCQIPVVLENVSAYVQMGGFDFLLEYDPLAVTFVEATPGQLLNECGWEYFAYRIGAQGNCGDTACPSGLLRMVAIADVNNGSNYPTCFLDSPGTLADMTFMTTSDEALQGWWPLRFWWYDCGDNAMSSQIGDSLVISYDVYDRNDYAGSYVKITRDTSFPTPFGAPSECLAGVSTYRGLDFFNGAVDITRGDSIDQRGDVNLNSIPYEIADYVVFVNYFLYGMSAFTVNVDGQIAATDINADGITLTLDDLVYLYRVIIGDALPFSKRLTVASDTIILVWDTTSRAVAVEYPDSLSASALYLVFDGQIEPTFELSNHSSDWHFDSTFTRILVTPWFDTLMSLPLIDSGLLFTYTGDGQIVSTEGAFDGVSHLSVAIRLGEVTGCCDIRGDVNHDSMGPDISDLVFLVECMFGFGPAPPCMEEADINGDGIGLDIADLVYLVTYMFQYGSPPSPCP